MAGIMALVSCSCSRGWVVAGWLVRTLMERVFRGVDLSFFFLFFLYLYLFSMDGTFYYFFPYFIFFTQRRGCSALDEDANDTVDGR